jgi:hypothetical protein
MTLIEIRPYRNGWEVYEAPGVQPVFLTKEQAISYAKSCTCIRSGEIRILDSTGTIKRSVGKVYSASEGFTGFSSGGSEAVELMPRPK